MRQTTMIEETIGSHSRQKRAHASLKALALAAAAALVATFAAPGAFASCGELGGAHGAGIKLPFLAAGDEPGWEMRNDSIVGLWQTSYTTAGGSPFGQSFKEWHSDGTEFENVDHSAIVGNVCFGVWKQVGDRTVRLHHMGWVFDDNGNPQGTFTIDETDVVARNGMRYTGSFVFKTYDVNGAFTGTEVSGTIAASRITVN